jgi:tRNA A37 N6-isopentenylltransferase MiaA
MNFFIFFLVQSESIKDYSNDFQCGIFQSIGFKEFDKYFEYKSNKANLNDVTEIKDSKEEELFARGVYDMKNSTKRYARYQIRWVKNKFIKSKQDRQSLQGTFLLKLNLNNLKY